MNDNNEFHLGILPRKRLDQRITYEAYIREKIHEYLNLMGFKHSGVNIELVEHRLGDMTPYGGMVKINLLNIGKEEI